MQFEPARRCDLVSQSALVPWDNELLKCPTKSFTAGRFAKPSSTSVCVLLFISLPMETVAPAASQALPDITFACAHCSSALVVDAAAAGMTLPCQRCGKPTEVPAIPVHETLSAKAEALVADLRRQLKENESQRTEITGYINQLSIQLHRWQLRLQTLKERREQLEKELRAAH
jgi:transcription elongation factor Elf1